MTKLCVCVCVDPWSWSLCVCVCVWKKKFLVVISLQRICRIPCRKEESVSVRFLTGNRKKLCVHKSFVQLLGAPWQESNPGMIVKKLYLHWAPTSDWCFPKEKGAVSLRCEPNGRTIETVLLDHGQAPFVWKVTEPAYSQGKVGCSPFEFGFYFNGRARRTLIPCEGPIVTFNRLWLFHLF